MLGKDWNEARREEVRSRCSADLLFKVCGSNCPGGIQITRRATVVQVVCPARGVYLHRRSRLRRPFLWDRYFFLTVNLLRGRSYLGERDFERLASAFDRRRQKHGSLLTAIRSRTALRWLADRTLALPRPSSALQSFLGRAGLVEEPRGRSTALANEVYDLRAGETYVNSLHIQG
jgi:hypothetical protein